MCNKKFLQVSYGGFGYMFLWFCPIHGHWYGFHLISGGEGRKDPFSSLVKYSPTAPTDIFYDFACQLSEYCLNRKPQYFLHTRFWHDIFHGITHKCGKCFKSSRICGMVGINSEICEQFAVHKVHWITPISVSFHVFCAVFYLSVEFRQNSKVSEYYGHCISRSIAKARKIK